jgi:hypothetical protein
MTRNPKMARSRPTEGARPSTFTAGAPPRRAINAAGAYGVFGTSESGAFGLDEPVESDPLTGLFGTPDPAT